jgi:hypothetical protein
MSEIKIDDRIISRKGFKKGEIRGTVIRTFEDDSLCYRFGRRIEIFVDKKYRHNLDSPDFPRAIMYECECKKLVKKKKIEIKPKLDFDTLHDRLMNYAGEELAKELAKLREEKKGPEYCKCTNPDVSPVSYKGEAFVCMQCSMFAKKEPKFEIGDKVEIISDKYFVTKIGMIGVVVSPLHYDDAHKVVRVAFGNNGCGYPIHKSDLKKIEEPKFKVGDWIEYNDEIPNNPCKAQIKKVLELYSGEWVYLLSNGCRRFQRHLTKIPVPELKLEVGKFYRTGEGEKAFCYHIDITSDTYYQASIVIMGKSYRYTTSLGGKFTQSPESHKLNIIEEWRD